MPHQMHELVEPSLAIVDGLARVVFLLGVIRVEETANAWMTRAIDVKQLAVTSYTAPPPDVHLGLGDRVHSSAARSQSKTRSLPYSNPPRSMETCRRDEAR